MTMMEAPDTIRDLERAADWADGTLRLPAQRRAPAAEAPPWLSDAFGNVLGEIKLYLKTAVAFGLRPKATAEAWADGRFRALNPLAYLLNSLLLLGPWRAMWQHILGVPSLSVIWEIIFAIGPFIAILVNGSITHLMFRAFGSKRPITSSWAVSIYTSGGLATLVQLASDPFALKLVAESQRTPFGGTPHFDPTSLAVTYSLSSIVIVMSVLGNAGLHGTTRRRAAAIFALTFVGWVVLVLVLTIVLALTAGLVLAPILRHLRH